MTACGAVPEPLNPKVAAPDGADHAALVVVAQWYARLPHGELLDVHDMPTVRWFEPDERGYLDYGSASDNHVAMGAYWSDEIHLIVRPTIHQSALSYEVLHWALDATTGDSDHDHTGPAWDQVREVRGALAEAGP